MNKVLHWNRFDICIISMYTILYKYIDYNLDTEKYENGTTIKMPKISYQTRHDPIESINWLICPTNPYAKTINMVRRTINWPFQRKKKHRVLKDFPCTSSIIDANYKFAKKRRPNPKLKMGNYLKFTQNLTNKRRPRDVANWLSQ